MHKKLGLLFSVNVDDINLVGKKQRTWILCENAMNRSSVFRLHAK